MKRVEVNEQVTVTAMGFRKNLAVYPRRIEFRGSSYNFIDAGLRCLVRRGAMIAEVLTLSDGESEYHLRSGDHGVNWTLLSIAS